MQDQGGRLEVKYYPDTSVVHIGGESTKTVSAVTESGRQISSLLVENDMLYFRKNYRLPGLGLVLHLFLVRLGDLLLLAKDVLKRRGLPAMLSNWQHASLSWCLLFQTRFVTRPTR